MRALLVALALSLTAFSMSGCASEQEKQEEFEACVEVCAAKQNIDTSDMNIDDISTALRRGAGGGKCFTQCGFDRDQRVSHGFSLINTDERSSALDRK